MAAVTVIFIIVITVFATVLVCMKHKTTCESEERRRRVCTHSHALSGDLSTTSPSSCSSVCGFVNRWHFKLHLIISLVPSLVCSLFPSRFN